MKICTALPFRRQLAVGAFACALLCTLMFPMGAFAEEGKGASAAVMPDSVELRIGSLITDEEVIENAIAETSTFALRTSGDSSVQTVLTYSGIDRYETSALQARDGWPEGSAVAILVSGYGWADALSASGLAGILDCPILLTPTDFLEDFVKDALVDLGVNKVVIVGGNGVVSDQVVEELGELGISDVVRLGGIDRYDTQMKVYEYGLGQWGSELVVLAKAAGERDFADALSASSLAFTTKSPVFLTDYKGNLNADQEQALLEGAQAGNFKTSLLLGGVTCVSSYSEDFMVGISQISTGSAKNVVRFAGADRWETSAKIASWAIEMGYLKADGASFSSGLTPFDSLGGGALAGREGTVLLLVADGCTSDAIYALQMAGGAQTVRFFGGTGAISQGVRDAVTRSLGVDVLGSISYVSYDITMDALADIEAAVSYSSKDEILYALNPENWPYGQSGFYQFAVLSDGYSNKVTADQINAFLDRWSIYQEANYGRTSSLRGTGEFFIEAAKTYNVNEVYLLAHAVIESAWGCSNLAAGTEYDGESFPYRKWDSDSGSYVTAYCSYPGYSAGKYYNFCGIGAVDSDAFRGGIKMAVSQGWNSPEAAIYGAAKWISDNYVNPTVSSAAVSGSQNTLYKMRWDINRAIAEGSVWHQYSTGLSWTEGISSVMSTFYSGAGMNMSDTGLRFELPIYKQ